MFRGEHINFLARLTLGQPAVCPRAIWTLTRAKSLCLCAFFLPEKYRFWSPPRKHEKISRRTRKSLKNSEFPNLVVLNLAVCNFTRKRSFALLCALLRPFALFCGLAFALFCAHLCPFACICVFLRPTGFRTTALGNCRKSRDLSALSYFSAIVFSYFRGEAKICIFPNFFLARNPCSSTRTGSQLHCD